MTIAIRGLKRGKFFRAFALAVLVSVFAVAALVNAASSGAVQVYASADDASPVIESVDDARSLSPIAEMTGAGGVKWFMVKTKSGNVGWIKAGDNSAAKIDDHFRALPKDSVLQATPASGPISTAPTSRVPAKGAISIPIQIVNRKVLVSVTLTSGFSSATGMLIVDTGAGQTMISKRMARQLRLFAPNTETGEGVGASFVANVGELDSIKVGSAEVKSMRVSIHDGGNVFGGEGLLGFDFLGRFQMSVDADKKVMVLIPRNQ